MNQLSNLNRSEKVVSSFKSEGGVALIEVLVALLIFSIGLLGIAGLQIKAMKYNQTALYRSAATGYAYDILDRMRVNASVARSGGYDFETGVDSDPSGTSVADQDVAAWLEAVRSLPAGQGDICRRTDPTDSACEGDGDFYVIRIQWKTAGMGDDAGEFSSTGEQTVTVVGRV